MKIWEVMREPARKVLPNTPLSNIRVLFRETEERIIPTSATRRRVST